MKLIRDELVFVKKYLKQVRLYSITMILQLSQWFLKLFFESVMHSPSYSVKLDAKHIFMKGIIALLIEVNWSPPYRTR